jgi:hypothetical protein
MSGMGRKGTLAECLEWVESGHLAGWMSSLYKGGGQAATGGSALATAGALAQVGDLTPGGPGDAYDRGRNGGFRRCRCCGRHNRPEHRGGILCFA